MSKQVEAPVPPPPQWAILELMGHRRVAGRISEVQRFGVTFCQLEVPNVTGGFRTALYGGSAIYGVHFVDEHEAREAANHASPSPFAWILDRQQLAAGRRGPWSGDTRDEEPDDDDSGDEDVCVFCNRELGDAFVVVDVERDGTTEAQRWHSSCRDEAIRLIVDERAAAPEPIEGT